MIIIGVTGDTGSGKTSACEKLREMGGTVIDADKLAHDAILRGEPAYLDIVWEFGPGIVGDNGQIDRKKLGEIVFSDGKKLKLLTDIIHRRVIKMTETMISGFRELPGPGFIVIDAPLLYEAGMAGICDYVVLITAGKRERLRRITERDGLTGEEAERRDSSRESAEAYRGAADFVIENEGDIAALHERIAGYAESLLRPE